MAENKFKKLYQFISKRYFYIIVSLLTGLFIILSLLVYYKWHRIASLHEKEKYEKREVLNQVHPSVILEILYDKTLNRFILRETDGVYAGMERPYPVSLPVKYEEPDDDIALHPGMVIKVGSYLYQYDDNRIQAGKLEETVFRSDPSAKRSELVVFPFRTDKSDPFRDEYQKPGLLIPGNDTDPDFGTFKALTREGDKTWFGNSDMDLIGFKAGRDLLIDYFGMLKSINSVDAITYLKNGSVVTDGKTTLRVSHNQHKNKQMLELSDVRRTIQRDQKIKYASLDQIGIDLHPDSFPAVFHGIPIENESDSFYLAGLTAGEAFRLDRCDGTGDASLLCLTIGTQPVIVDSTTVEAGKTIEVRPGALINSGRLSLRLYHYGRRWQLINNHPVSHTLSLSRTNLLSTHLNLEDKFGFAVVPDTFVKYSFRHLFDQLLAEGLVRWEKYMLRFDKVTIQEPRYKALKKKLDRSGHKNLLYSLILNTNRRMLEPAVSMEGYWKVLLRGTADIRKTSLSPASLRWFYSIDGADWRPLRSALEESRGLSELNLDEFSLNMLEKARYLTFKTEFQVPAQSKEARLSLVTQSKSPIQVSLEEIKTGKITNGNLAEQKTGSDEQDSILLQTSLLDTALYAGHRYRISIRLDIDPEKRNMTLAEIRRITEDLLVFNDDGQLVACDEHFVSYYNPESEEKTSQRGNITDSDHKSIPLLEADSIYLPLISKTGHFKHSILAFWDGASVTNIIVGPENNRLFIRFRPGSFPTFNQERAWTWKRGSSGDNTIFTISPRRQPENKIEYRHEIGNLAFGNVWVKNEKNGRLYQFMIPDHFISGDFTTTNINMPGFLFSSGNKRNFIEVTFFGKEGTSADTSEDAAFLVRKGQGSNDLSNNSYTFKDGDTLSWRGNRFELHYFNGILAGSDTTGKRIYQPGTGLSSVVGLDHPLVFKGMENVFNPVLKDGGEITLTIDDHLQRIFRDEVLVSLNRMNKEEEEILNYLKIKEDTKAVAMIQGLRHEAAVVALNARTGEIMALVSEPALDMQRLTFSELKKNVESLDNGLTNTVLTRQLSPASNFKPVTAIAALIEAYQNNDPVIRNMLEGRLPDALFQCPRPEGERVNRLEDKYLPRPDIEAAYNGFCPDWTNDPEYSGLRISSRLRNYAYGAVLPDTRLSKALGHSLNTYFGSLALLLNTPIRHAQKFHWLAQGTELDKVETTAIALGYNRRYDLIPEEAYSIAPLGRQSFDGLFSNPGHFINAVNYQAHVAARGIGQAENVVTPIHLATIFSIIANRGFQIKPNFLKGIGPSWTFQPPEKGQTERVVKLDDAQWEMLEEGMKNVIVDDHGTAYHAFRANKYRNTARLMGKTGTSENSRHSLGLFRITKATINSLLNSGIGAEQIRRIKEISYQPFQSIKELRKALRDIPGLSIMHKQIILTESLAPYSAEKGGFKNIVSRFDDGWFSIIIHPPGQGGDPIVITALLTHSGLGGTYTASMVSRIVERMGDYLEWSDE